MKQITITIYTDADKAEVQQLIVSIQRDEFGIDIDLPRQPDLNDILGFYQNGVGNFWVAKSEGKAIGTIALLDIGNSQAALRKMFVDRNFRGKEFKVGQRLLDTLIDHARETKIREIYLGTTAKFVGAQRFYEKNNFTEIDKRSLPEKFPIMSVDVKFYQRTVIGHTAE